MKCKNSKHVNHKTSECLRSFKSVSKTVNPGWVEVELTSSMLKIIQIAISAQYVPCNEMTTYTHSCTY